MSVAKEQIRQIISENSLNSVTDVYSLLRDSFKDILQELMEAELDASIGYEKNIKGIYKQTINAMDTLPKPSRASMGSSGLTYPGTAKESLNPD